MKIYNKKYFLLYLFTLLLGNITVSAQVGIGTTSPKGMLDLQSSNTGIVFPKVALTNAVIALPVVNPNGGSIVAGTVVYNTNYTNTGTNDVYPGVYAWNGSKWIGQYIKEQTEKYEQTPLDFRTTVTGGFVDVPALNAGSFTAKYTGKYKVVVHFNFSAGKLDPALITDRVGMATEEGFFRFIFNGTNHDIYTHSYSIYNKEIGGGTHFEGFKHESNLVLYLDLVAGTTYPFKLQIDQLTATSFISGGNGGDGRGRVGLDVPCSVAITFLYE